MAKFQGKRAGQASHPTLGRAEGLSWLLRYMKGERINAIAASTKHHRITIKKYMKQVAEEMVGEAQAKVMSDLVPLATEVLKAALANELKSIQAGNPPNIALADRVLKGMSIIDQNTKPEHDDQDNESDTLVAVLQSKNRKKFLAKQVPLELNPVTPPKDGVLVDAHEDNPDSQS